MDFYFSNIFHTGKQFVVSFILQVPWYPCDSAAGYKNPQLNCFDNYWNLII